MSKFSLPNLGTFSENSGLISLEECSDDIHRAGQHGVISVTATGDRKVEFIAFEDTTLAYVNSRMGYPAYYPVHPVKFTPPFQAVLMDLDGTSIHSEDFWVWIIQATTATLLENPKFELEDEDLPFVAGHSVSEHLTHCVNKYCPDKRVEEARQIYFEHTHREMAEIVNGRGKSDVFKPAPGLKDFLLTLKSDGVKIGLVTSGLYEKAYPGILSAFRTLGLGDPKDFYDVIITGGFPLRKGETGTLGELSPKPHPWMYAEAARVGLGIPFEQRHSVVGVEDSGAGVCSIRLAGFSTIGISGGNIVESGTKSLCNLYCESFSEILKNIR
ncbi:MAG: HAD hydrolase-like protein [Chloroflexi bacterium]|nr:HAD hydrolase-like protein [Chloroflexota bacterium]